MTARETPESQTGPGQVNSKLKGRIDEINAIYILRLWDRF